MHDSPTTVSPTSPRPRRHDGRRLPPSREATGGGISQLGVADALLEAVVRLAVDLLPGVDAASLSRRHRGADTVDTAAATSAAVRSLDLVQYQAGAGPCLEAIAGGRAVGAPIPAGRWAAFSSPAADEGFRSVRSVPLAAGAGPPTGALNLYSCSPALAADGELAVDERARLVVVLAATVVDRVGDVEDVVRLNANLRVALETRTVIGQAQGMLMERQHIGESEAFDILRRASQRTNRKLRQIAAEVLADLDRAAPGDGRGRMAVTDPATASRERLMPTAPIQPDPTKPAPDPEHLPDPVPEPDPVPGTPGLPQTPEVPPPDPEPVPA